MPEHLTDVFVPAYMVKASPDPSPLIFMKSTSIILSALRAKEKSALDTMMGARRIMNDRCVSTSKY